MKRWIVLPLKDQKPIEERLDIVDYLVSHPEISYEIGQRLKEIGDLERFISKVAVVIDCTDNFVTRHLINRISLKHEKTLVSGAAIGFDAQISVFDFRQASSPCYACVFPPDPHFVETSCASMGVFSPLVGIIGSLQAAQALQILIGFGEPLLGRLLIWNARNSQIDEIKIQRNLDCPVCGAR